MYIYVIQVRSRRELLFMISRTRGVEMGHRLSSSEFADELVVMAVALEL